MFNVQARFVRRDTDDETDGLILGATYKKNTLFKRGYVYEVAEVMGENVIREVGRSHIARADSNGRYGTDHIACWGQDISTIVDLSSRYLLLTKEELDAARRSGFQP